MAQQEASSSCSFTHKWIYDVFLSFRGEDTRHNFTCNLYNALHGKGILTFIDDEGLRRGEEITPGLLKAIQNSRIVIIVFSKNYAFSTFCLDELIKILECSKEEGRSVFPIFYDVDPSQVRHQTGTYSEALAKHEEKFKDDNDKVQRWRNALYEAANLSGWHFQLGSQKEYNFIREIADVVSDKINHIPLHVAENPTGLEYAVQEVKSLLGHGSDVNMIGLYGVGGIGKTTIARAVYNSIFNHFEGMCFMSDIREKAINKHGLVQLQEMLLSEILKEKDIRVGDVNRGIPVIKRRLQQKKVLLVLDDVDELEQLQALAGKYDWFGSGSVIIFTTRDKHLLATHEVKKLYEVKPLNNEKALELFNWHAFKNAKADPSFVNISKRAVSYACGLPLALEVIGSHLFGKSLNECNSALDKYGKIPHKKIQEILKVCYDGLEENEQRIFLDIACSFISCKKDYVSPVLHASGFHAEDGLTVLVDRSLIKIDASGFVRMHDLIRDMGREIVRQESTLEPGRRSRLWFQKDIIRVLEENMGTDKIEFIKLEGYKNIEVQWNGEAFKEMKNLRVLIIKNTTFSTGPKHLPSSLRVLDWRFYPLQSVPSDYNPKQLEILSMPKSFLQIFPADKKFHSLSTIRFEACEILTDVLSLSELPFLTDLCLDNCTNLVKIDDSIGFLEKLRTLSAKGCTKLKILAPRIMLPSLEILNLRKCSCLESFPEVLGRMEKVRKIRLDDTAIERLPFSISNFVGLQQLSLRRCKRLNQLPGSICILPNVEVNYGFGRRIRFFEENLDEEKLSSQVSPNAILNTHNYYLGQGFTYLDVYYPYTSPNNVIQVCSPNQLMHLNFLYLFEEVGGSGNNNCNKQSMHFSFRNTFPKITVCCRIRSSFKHLVALILTLTVIINGTKQLTCSCNYLYDIWRTHRTELVCDLQSNLGEGMFSEREWNEAEILFEFKLPQPNGKARSNSFKDLEWTLIGVYEEGNSKEDIAFRTQMSIFSFRNREPLSSLPTCLYYVVSYPRNADHLLPL